MVNLKEMTTPALFVLHAALADELRHRGVMRSSNSLVGDLAEHLFCRAFGWRPAANSMRDADATDDSGIRYQVKSRRLTQQNPSRQLGALRDLPQQGFDILAAVLFDSDYRVQRATLIPHARVLELATFVQRTNSWRFMLRDSVWSLPDVEDTTEQLRRAEKEWAEAELTLEATGA